MALKQVHMLLKGQTPDAFGSDPTHGVSVERRGGIALAGR